MEIEHAPQTVVPEIEHSRDSQGRRCTDALIFVGAWIALGFGLHLDANSYLLLGVPLLLLFHFTCRQKPFFTVWVRDAEEFRFTRLALFIALLLAVLPASQFFSHGKSTAWSVRLWELCCIAGAFPAGFALSKFNRATGKALVFCFGTAGLIGVVIMISSAALRHTLVFQSHHLMVGVRSFLLYLPIGFVLEEVVFRGAIDAHVFQRGDAGRWRSAFFTSALWGVWHLPTVRFANGAELIAVAVAMLIIHCAVGVFLSLGWRRSGNLAVPALVHAFIDAVRNSLMQ